MAAETKLRITGWEMEDVAGGIGFPSYPAAVPVLVKPLTEVKTPMYDTEAAATGLPMYLGGTMSKACLRIEKPEQD